MGGFFGITSKEECLIDVFFGVDYHSHLGTRRGLANQVETMVSEFPLDIKVAVMGCVVNGPGEAKEADLGVAGGIGEGLIIKKGEVYKKVPETELLNALRYELENWGK